MAFGEEQNRFFEEQAKEAGEMAARSHARAVDVHLAVISVSLRRIASSMEILITPVRATVFVGEVVYSAGQALKRDIKGSLDYLFKRGDYGDLDSGDIGCGGVDADVAADGGVCDCDCEDEGCGGGTNK